MINEDVIAIAKNRIGIELGKQRAELSTDIRGITAKFNSKGMLHSGTFVVAVASRCSEMAEARCELAWTIIHRAITTAGAVYSDAMGAQLKGVFEELVGFGDLHGEAKKAANLINMKALEPQVESIVNEGRARGVARANNEIELFTVQLKNQQKAAAAVGPGPTFNVYAPVGNIQTGSHSVATVYQTLNDEGKGKLDDALGRLEEALGRIDALPGDSPKAEIVEIVQEARAEVAKPQPNMSKLKGLLTTTATAVRTVAAVKPAYDTLKQVAEAVVGLLL